MLRRRWNRAGADERLNIERRLEGPPLPFPLRHIWQWFFELSDARSSGGMGPASISYQDIAAWSRLTGHRPSPWEVSVIRDLDRLWMSIIPDPKAAPAATVDEDGEVDGDTLRKRLDRFVDAFS